MMATKELENNLSIATGERRLCCELEAVLAVLDLRGAQNANLTAVPTKIALSLSSNSSSTFRRF
jgi:hypothetical protein